MRLKHDDPPNLDPPLPGQPFLGNAGAGPIVLPPSTYYPYGQQVSLLMTRGGIVRMLVGVWLDYVAPDDYTILTMLKTSADPLKHGDVVQLQAPSGPVQGGFLMYNLENPAEPKNYLKASIIGLWRYAETSPITDPRTQFAVYRVDGKDQVIFGPTDVRLLATNGGFVRRSSIYPNPNNSPFDQLNADGGIDSDNVFTLIFIP